MLKFFLIFVLVLGAAFGIPPVRARVVPHMQPVLDRLGPVGERISRPTKRWAAKGEETIFIRKLAEDHAEHKELPTPLSFQMWIKTSTRGGKGGLDPWGHPYYLVRTEHQITVGSQGPDRRRNTPDDIRITVPIE